MRCEMVNWNAETSSCDFVCPECGGKVSIPNTTLSDVGGATFNCIHCSADLIGVVHANVVVATSFHGYLNMHNPEWPADGAGAGVISIPSDNDVMYDYW